MSRVFVAAASVMAGVFLAGPALAQQGSEVPLPSVEVPLVMTSVGDNAAVFLARDSVERDGGQVNLIVYQAMSQPIIIPPGQIFQIVQYARIDCAANTFAIRRAGAYDAQDGFVAEILTEGPPEVIPDGTAYDHLSDIVCGAEPEWPEAVLGSRAAFAAGMAELGVGG